MTKIFEAIGKGIIENLGGFEGTAKLVLLLCFFIAALGIVATIIMYKHLREDRAAYLKQSHEDKLLLVNILQKSEQHQESSALAHQELTKSGIQTLKEVNNTLVEQSNNVSKNNILLDKIFDILIKQ